MSSIVPAKPLLSVVSPAFNEEDVLPAFHAELVKVLETLTDDIDYEIIYVDDGSADATPLILTRFSLADSRVHFIRLSRNFGHQCALTAGLEFARGDIVVTMDSDLQHPPRLIPELIAGWQAGHDIVVTIREYHRSIGLFKRLSSRLFAFAMRYCSGMEIRPSASDFRLMSRKAPMRFCACRNVCVSSAGWYTGWASQTSRCTSLPRRDSQATPSTHWCACCGWLAMGCFRFRASRCTRPFCWPA